MNVDISGTGASLGALPRPAKVSGVLVRLGMACICAFAAVGAGYELVRMLIERTEPPSDFAYFGGWQLDAMAAALGAAVLALLVVSSVTGVRTFHRLRGVTPNRRVVVWAALLPGLFLGGLAGLPMRSAISWSSDHTAAAKHAYAEFRQMDPRNPSTPPMLFPILGTAAPAAIASHLLHPADLGIGWYDGGRPNPSQSLAASWLGQTLAARSQLNQWHWTGRIWSPGDLASEVLDRFSTPEAAQHYLAVWGRDASSRVNVAGTTVFEHDSNVARVISHTATFRVGNDVYTLDMTGTSGAAEFNAVVAKAVRRATTGR
jgi:hypothetical protein